MLMVKKSQQEIDAGILIIVFDVSSCFSEGKVNHLSIGNFYSGLNHRSKHAFCYDSHIPLRKT